MMENRSKWLLVLALAMTSHIAMSQSKDEELIRGLEQEERMAVLKGDTAKLFRELWSPGFIVNNPANMVVTRPQIAELIRSGKINYESFERIIEKISVIDHTAIVMGREELKPQGETDNAGKQVVRRFTNVWVRQQGKWKLAGRQATIVSMQ
jgi:hypothetical protein